MYVHLDHLGRDEFNEPSIRPRSEGVQGSYIGWNAPASGGIAMDAEEARETAAFLHENRSEGALRRILANPAPSAATVAEWAAALDRAADAVEFAQALSNSGAGCPECDTAALSVWLTGAGPVAKCQMCGNSGIDLTAQSDDVPEMPEALQTYIREEKESDAQTA